jgi:hypothetical protein
MMRLPKPAATNVVNKHIYLGGVYTAKQMRVFAAKSVAAENEACAAILDANAMACHSPIMRSLLQSNAQAIRSRRTA